MKKLLKTFAVCLIAIVSSFTFFACDVTIDGLEFGRGDSGETSSPENTYTADECYTKIKGLVGAINPANGYRLDTTFGEELSVDYSNANFEELGFTDEDSINALKEDIDSEMKRWDCLDKTIIEYNATDKTGYTFSYSYDNIVEYWASNDEYLYRHLVSQESQAGVMPIARELPNKYKVQIDDEYYHQYMYDFNKELENINKFFSQDSLDDLKTFVLINFKIQQISITPTFTIEFSEKDDFVSLNIKVELKDVPSFYDIRNHGAIKLNNVTEIMELTINFNDTEILDITGKETYIGSASLDIEDYLDNAEVSEKKLVVNETLSNSYKYVIAEYDGEDKPEIVDEEFVPSGYDGEIEINESLVSLYIDGYLCESSYREMGVAIDKSKMFKDHDGINFHDIIGNMTDMTWYIDKECTIPYTSNTYPSYDINLYAKLSEIDIKDGWAFNTEITLDTYDENIDYSQYFRVLNIGGTTRGFIANGEYSCMYINGEKLVAGVPYNLDPGKVNQIIRILKPSTEA